MDTPTLPLATLMRDMLQVFDETFEVVTGVYLNRGTSLFETLADITAAEASIPVGNTCAALSAQVDHVRFYLDVMEDVLLDREQDNYDWADIWNRVEAVTDDEWTAIQARLRDSHQRVRALITTPERWISGTGFSGAVAAAVHTAYHLGEIRQALCTIRPA